MTALSALTAHFDKLKSQSFEVPGVTQADGTPLVVYFNPPTNAEATRLEAQVGTRRSDAKITLWTVILLARNADGSRMFSEDAETVQALSERVPSRVLAQIANAIMGVTPRAALGN